MKAHRILFVATAALALLATPTLASSHREAPGITKTPKVDGTDFYMFRSYESVSAGMTLLANYLQTLQDGWRRPNLQPRPGRGLWHRR